MSLSDNPIFQPVPGVEPTAGGAYIWRYDPSKSAAVIFLLLFLASTLYISWRIWKTRTWFCIIFAVGCLFEVAGYAARIGSAGDTSRIMTFAVQNTYILVAPALFAASIYMTLGRVIPSVRAEKHSPIRPSRVTKTFVAGDIISFLIQGGAAGMMFIQQSGMAEWSERLVILGLMAQVVMFGLFAVVAAVFHRRIRLAPTSDSFDKCIPWEETLYMLYSVSALIMARSIFRVIEFATGTTGYLLSHEWPLYAFDSLPMWLVTVIFAWKLPAGLKPSEHIPL